MFRAKNDLFKSIENVVLGNFYFLFHHKGKLQIMYVLMLWHYGAIFNVVLVCLVLKTIIYFLRIIILLSKGVFIIRFQCAALKEKQEIWWNADHCASTKKSFIVLKWFQTILWIVDSNDVIYRFLKKIKEINEKDLRWVLTWPFLS